MIVILPDRFPEVELLQTAPGVGIITACRFVAYLQTPRRFSNKRKLWRYCRLGITRRESNGKRLAHPRLDTAGVGSLKDVSRKVFEAARRTKKDNSFKRFYRAIVAQYEKCGSRTTFHATENLGNFASDVALDAAVSRFRRLNAAQNEFINA